ncbi:MAG: hypothetical protein JKY20_07605 [Alphaproteobacteria bacterium]|nr:hypothetical protein [Alphaproteobacteria bacterium]
MKKLLVIVGVLVVIAVGATVLLFAGLDDLVKTAVEKGGSEATQVKVTLVEASVKPTEGSATLTGLVVGNPDGFKTDNAFSLGEISVKIDPASVTQNPIIIKEVIINKPVITYELGSGGSNIDAIKKNVERLAGSGGGSSGDGDGPKVIIEHLYVRGGAVNVSATALGGKTLSASLPEIHLTDIGKDNGGADANEVASKIMAALTDSVGGFVSGLDISSVFEGMANVPDSLKGMAGGAMEKAGDVMKSVTGGSSDMLKNMTGGGSGDATKGVGDAVKGAGDAVKSLFSK